MNKLKLIFLIYVLASIASCFGDCFFSTDCGDRERKLPAYANKSGETVKIVAIAKDNPPYEKVIANGDTLYNEPTEKWNVLFLVFCDRADCRDNPIRIELHFLDDRQKCLVFDGPVKHDGIDPRSWELYKKGKKLDNISTYFTAYVYTITPEHKAMAKDPDSCRIEDK